LFREQLTEAGLIERLFHEFEVFLGEKGFSPRKAKSSMPVLFPLPDSAIAGTENQQIKAGRFRTIGVIIRNDRKIMMHDGLRRTVRIIMVTKSH